MTISKHQGDAVIESNKWPPTVAFKREEKEEKWKPMPPDMDVHILLRAPLSRRRLETTLIN